MDQPRITCHASRKRYSEVWSGYIRIHSDGTSYCDSGDRILRNNRTDALADAAQLRDDYLERNRL